MFVKTLNECEAFVANDGCHIKELLHPGNDPVDLPYSIAIAKIETGNNSYRHKLQQIEVYHILSGQGLLHVDDETRELNIGDVAVIPAEAIQWIENNGDGDLVFAAIVSPPWKAEDDQRLE